MCFTIICFICTKRIIRWIDKKKNNCYIVVFLINIRSQIVTLEIVFIFSDRISQTKRSKYLKTIHFIIFSISLSYTIKKK